MTSYAMTARADTPPTVLPSIVENMRGGSDEEKLDALSQLAQITETSVGVEAEDLCEHLRVAGAVGLISGLLEHDDAAIHQTAMLLIGNIASETYDPKADATKLLLKRHRAFGTMLRHLFSSDTVTLEYTLRAVQNTCAELEYVELMQEMGAVARVQELVSSGNEQLEQYALGCLANMRQTILASTTQESGEEAAKLEAAATQGTMRAAPSRDRTPLMPADLDPVPHHIQRAASEAAVLQTRQKREQRHAFRHMHTENTMARVREFLTASKVAKPPPPGPRNLFFLTST